MSRTDGYGDVHDSSCCQNDIACFMRVPRCLVCSKMGSLMQGDDFQHILRLLNTNVDGKNKIMYALTSIKGMGRRFSNLVCKKAEVDLRKRAGEYIILLL